MSHVVLISGSPAASAKSNALLAHIATGISKLGFSTATIVVRDFPAQDLVHAKFDSPAFEAPKALIASASGVVVATPVYKAAYSGLLKTFLDILPQTAFRGKTVLPIATGGSPGHLLAIDFSVKPLLAALAATDVLQGVYAVDAQFSTGAEGNVVIGEEIVRRLDDSVQQLAANLRARGVPAAVVSEK
ncbi:MAG TPA: NADPH-dependent FMN reductase [Opitutaceae bacterium]|nr:NADPH-dependent FMN reductase [Opitutaceae bacterium]